MKKLLKTKLISLLTVFLLGVLIAIGFTVSAQWVIESSYEYDKTVLYDENPDYKETNTVTETVTNVTPLSLEERLEKVENWIKEQDSSF